MSDLIHKTTAETMDKAEIAVSGNCVVCGKQLNCRRLLVCRDCESKRSEKIDGRCIP